jgi:hypothetical protein
MTRCVPALVAEVAKEPVAEATSLESLLQVVVVLENRP